YIAIAITWSPAAKPVRPVGHPVAIRGRTGPDEAITRFRLPVRPDERASGAFKGTHVDGAAVTPLVAFLGHSPITPSNGPAGGPLVLALQQFGDRGPDECGGVAVRRVAHRLADAVAGGLVEAECDDERLSNHSGLLSWLRQCNMYRRESAN